MWLEIVAAALAIIFIIYKITLGEDKGGKKWPSKKIPGVEPSDPEEGNRKDIEKAGTLSDYLRELHEKYGPIVRFYEGKKMSIGIASPDMLKQIRHLFKSPNDIFKQLALLTGPEFLQFCDVDEIKRRRKVYDHHFMMSACKAYSDNFIDISKAFTEKWIKTEGEQIPLMKTMERYSLTSLLRCCFGDVFKDEKTLDEYQDLVDWVWRHFDPNPKEGTEVYKTIVEKSSKARNIVQKIIDERRQKKRTEDDPQLFIDVLLETDLSEDARKADVTGVISGGYFTTASVLTWVVYEIARQPDIQDKIYEEIVTALGDETLTVENISKLTFLRQVIDECLRIYMNPTVTARIAETDMEIGGYHVPINTVIYQKFGPVFNDPQIWKNPEKFDPNRFSRENSRGRSPYAFKPFGFAGKRVCPGMNFAMSEMTIFISECLRRCRLHLVPGQDVKKIPGFLLAPAEEIMITIEKRR